MNPSLDHSSSLSHDHLEKKSWFQSAFPVPHSLILSDVSVYISDGTLRFFEFSRSHGRMYPKAFGTHPFPRFHIATLDEKMREEASSVLRKWASERKYKAVNLVIHEDEAYVFKVAVSTADKNQLRSAIEGVLEENVPIPPAEAIFEYEVIDVDQKLQETIVAVSVLSKKSVIESIDLIEAAGVKVVSLDTEARALARALFHKSDRGVHAVLSIAERHSIIFIVENGAVVFSSSLKIGSVDVDRAVAKTFGITEENARKLKIEKAFTEIDGDVKLFEAMLPIFANIRDELMKVVVYWRGQLKKERNPRDVADIILAGSDSLVSGFDRYIAVTTKIPARVGSVWTNVLSINEAVPELPRRESLDYGIVIGTLL